MPMVHNAPVVEEARTTLEPSPNRLIPGRPYLYQLRKY